jgi:hypothetical protein
VDKSSFRLFSSGQGSGSNNNNNEEDALQMDQIDDNRSSDVLPFNLSPSPPSKGGVSEGNNNVHSSADHPPKQKIVHDHCEPLYDLIGVSNHHGSLNGGHYIAHVDTNYGRKSEKGPRWMCFNDARVSNANTTSLAGPTAYVLFYRLRGDSVYHYEPSSSGQQ